MPGLLGEAGERGRMPAVSVIMPVYNAERFLEQAIASVLGQTFRDIEVIAVNDGSTDTSHAILMSKAVSDRRVRILDGPNCGYGHAMNAGMEAATGDYVAILEPDDYYDMDFLDRVLSVAREFDADIVKTKFWEHSEETGSDSLSDPLGNLPMMKPIDIMSHPSLSLMRPTIWTAVYRRSIIADNRIRFRETPGASFQDTYFSFAALVHARRIVLVPEPHMHYRIDNETSSVHSGGKPYAVCRELEAMDALADSRKEWHDALMPWLFRRRLDTYGWNYDRLAPEFREDFRRRAAMEFAQGEAEGFLDRSLYDDAAWDKLQWFIDGKHGDALDEFRKSASYRVGHAALQPIRCGMRAAKGVAHAIRARIG